MVMYEKTDWERQATRKQDDKHMQLLNHVKSAGNEKIITSRETAQSMCGHGSMCVCVCLVATVVCRRK